jgi:protein tyrosine phosphatase (PTP) superfamily phosphohydrolase (DUF442 family)
MLEEIYNFLPLTENLLSSGMPTAEQMADVSNAGVRLVINLTPFDPERNLLNEDGLVNSLGMEYANIPVEWDSPTRQNLESFMNAMDAHRQDKVLVHCQANFRATGFITLYRILRLGWKREEAFMDLRRIWNPEEYPVWQKFIEDNLAGRP